MKRNTFLKSLAGLAIAPVVISQIPKEELSDAEKMLKGAKEIDRSMELTIDKALRLEDYLRDLTFQDELGNAYLKTIKS